MTHFLTRMVGKVVLFFGVVAVRIDREKFGTDAHSPCKSEESGRQMWEEKEPNRVGGSLSGVNMDSGVREAISFFLVYVVCPTTRKWGEWSLPGRRQY